MATTTPASGESSGTAAETSCAPAVGRGKRASAMQADKAWRHQPEVKEPVAPKPKKPKLDPNRVHPKAYTDMATLRKLMNKYSAEQVEWCNRRFPQALRDLGWQVLPEDMGSNYSSYGEAHYMYAFSGQGIAKKGKNTLPYFSSKEDALAWWEQRLHDQARADASAPLTALQRLKPLVRDENGVIIEAGGERLQLQPSSTRKATGYVGVTEKTEVKEGKRTSVFVAKTMGEYLGTFGTAAEAARAYAQHMLARDAAKPPQPTAAAAAGTAVPGPAVPGPALPKGKTTAARASAAQAQSKDAAPAAPSAPAAPAAPSAPAARSALPAPALAAASAPAAAPGAATMRPAVDAPVTSLAPRPSEAAPEGAAVEWSEGGGEDEGAGWDAEAGEAGADRAPAPGETQKEHAARLRLSKEGDPSRPQKKVRPPPLPQHLEMKATKPEPKSKPPLEEGGAAGGWEGASMLEDIRRRAAELSGYGYQEEEAAQGFEEAHVVVASAADDDEAVLAGDVAAVETVLSPSAVAPS